MTGIKKLAKVTVSDFEETYYAQNRVNGLIVTGGCTLLLWTCFKNFYIYIILHNVTSQLSLLRDFLQILL